MEAIEFVAMVGALFLMVGSVVAKVFTAQMISRMKHQIGHVATIKQEALALSLIHISEPTRPY